MRQRHGVRKITTFLGVFLCGLFVSMGAAHADRAADAQSHGAQLQRKGDLKGALREFDRAVQLSPTSALAWYNRGLVRRQMGKCTTAINDFGRALELQADFFNALYQRGNCLQSLGQYTKAVADYSRAIELPGRIDARFLAYFGRADARRRLGQLDQSYADYTRVIELRTDTTAMRSRAWVSFYRGRWADAFRDAAQYVHDTEAKEPDTAYVLILGTLSLRREGRTNEAAIFLNQWSANIDSRQWPWPVISYLQNGDENALRAAAKRPGERTEALAYLAADLLSQGNQAEAVIILRQVLREGEPAYLEYDLAYHELTRLGLAQPKDRRRR